MNFVNETPLEAGWTVGIGRDDRETLMVAVKATFDFPQKGGRPELSAEQLPLVEADEFTGEPGLSAPLRETDYSRYKPHCDVLLIGNAYAPGGRPTDQVEVSMVVGPIEKSFRVVGDRFWLQTMLGGHVSAPRLFDVMPISYDNAFGGVDDSDPENVMTFMPNPVGRGYHPRKKDYDQKPLPNTEELYQTIKSPKGGYQPMSFGPIGRAWSPRLSFTGTYDQEWTENRAPYWPHDFDCRYFQCAPQDQQMPYPRGSEHIYLKNLSPRGDIHFTLSADPIPVLVIPHREDACQLEANVDTIVLEPEHERFTMTWRAVLPLKRDAFELKEVVVDKRLAEHQAKQEFEYRCRTCGA